jgi:lipase maturation factor 1
MMTTVRPEIVIEGSDDGVSWKEYAFRHKPGDPQRAPRWIAPYHPRLDWQMWFAALRGAQRTSWFNVLMLRLLEGKPEVLRLLGTNPFPDAPPRYVRALLYSYRYTRPGTAEARQAWWERELLGLYYPTISLHSQ